MKHDLSIIILLAALFLVSQLVGLTVLYRDMDVQQVNGTTVVSHGTTVIGDRPDIHGFDAFVFFVIAVAVGTAMILLIMYARKYVIWKLLFLYAVVVTMAVAFGVFVGGIEAFALALLLGIWKLFRPNPIVHNVTEVFMYAGVALIFVPLFDVTWIIALLLLISVYDVIAVFRSRHMVKLAQFQTQGSAFPGLLLRYAPKKAGKQGKTRVLAQDTKRVSTKTARSIPASASQATAAILGGGDIVFPLLFAGVVLESLIAAGADPLTAMAKTLIIPLIATAFLAILLVKGQRGKFYPAMPVMTAACLVGYGIIWLL